MQIWCFHSISLSHLVKFLPISPFFYLSPLLLASIVLCLFFSSSIYNFFSAFVASEHEVCVLWIGCNSRIKRTCELRKLATNVHVPGSVEFWKIYIVHQPKFRKLQLKVLNLPYMCNRCYKVFKFLRFHLYSSFLLAWTSYSIMILNFQLDDKTLNLFL
jgi:hypothetical protein